jgi:hypothetical protein
MDFSSIGITVFDILLPLACAFGAVIGSFVQAMLATINHDGPPTTYDELKIAPPKMREIRHAWLSMRAYIGGVLGFIFGLYFIGMLDESPGTFARIWALSFIVGYAAPKIWVAKSNAFVSRVNAERGEQ